MRDLAAQEWPTGQVRNWLLAILRFAVTLEQADRVAVLALAGILDRSGAGVGAGFSFFTRTSTEFCNAIAEKDDSKRIAALRLHLARIDDCRLRRALEAACGCDAAARNAAAAKGYRRAGLWKGLSPAR